MHPYLRVALAYFIFGALWIFGSDRLLEWFTQNAEQITWLQTLKGWAFVAASTLLVGVLSRNACRAQQERERQCQRVFRSTVEGSYHILRNYLNQMQLVVIEAERSRDFDPETIVLARSLSHQATVELEKLGNLTDPTPERIHRHVYGQPCRSPSQS